MSDIIKIGNHEVVHITHVRELRRELAEAQEYARKLSIKCVDLGKDVEALKANLQRKQDAGDLLFEELDDLTPEADCKCIPHGWKCSSCKFNDARKALKAWKEASSESALKPVVRYVEEVNGGMGPDYAEIYLATGHVIQVGNEGLLLWPSVAAYESGEDCQIMGGVSFESKEVKP